MDGLDLVPLVTSAQRFDWDETTWELGEGYGRQDEPQHHVVAIDYGVKRNILRLLAEAGCEVTVVPATATAEDVLALEARRRLPLQRPRRSGGDRRIRRADDPAACSTRRSRPSASASATRCSASPSARKTTKMHQGHHGANHPVKDLTTGKVEITSMNHGFAVDPATLPANAVRDPRLALRRLELRHRAHRPAGLLGAVPPRSLARPAGQPLPLRPLRRADRGREVEERKQRSFRPSSSAESRSCLNAVAGLSHSAIRITAAIRRTAGHR